MCFLMRFWEEYRSDVRAVGGSFHRSLANRNHLINVNIEF